jgi:histidyl-tRNA synthetase
MKKFQSVRGMKDILPNESKCFRNLENVLMSSANQFGFEEIKTPILEDTNLFIKSIGDGTDIIEKEMYTFIDAKNNSFSMRPEGTASCARALVEHGLNDSINKVWYSGPFFRHERPQKGRYRQFHQFGAEFTGVEGYEADLEIINLINYIWESLGVNPELKINTIGDMQDRQTYILVLLDYFDKYKNDFNEAEKNKLKLNPLRLLDSKNKDIKEIIMLAPKITDYISKDSKLHFENILSILDKKNIKYNQDDKLVRGLDYYNRTVFEYIDKAHESQNTICAGGRYDFLFENLCDKKIPALGFAIGIERLLEYMNFNLESKKTTLFYVVVMNEDNYSYSQNIANIIRKISKNYIVSNSYNYVNLKSQLKKANKLSADYCVIIGDEECSSNTCQIKNMDLGSQDKVDLDNIELYLKNNIGDGK